MRLQIEREPFAASGGIDGRAARRAMGKPDIEFWDLFLRETLQNSWDAKSAGSTSISFSIDAVSFGTDQMQELADVFVDASGLLAEFLGSEGRHTALLVSDRRTRGLGGVTRADTAALPNESRDYVDFLRNVGRASSKTLGGGTYGFGKGVLYDASAVDACLVYSQTRIDGAIVNRLVGSCVREQFEIGGRRFTGRHWWGVAGEDGVVDPLTGNEARLMAELIGIAALDADETGTVVAVLDPKLPEGESIGSVVEQLAGAARFWAWPHMVDVGSGPSIEFGFSVDGQTIQVLHPAEDPVLQHFVRAYEKAVPALAVDNEPEIQWPWSVKPVEMLRPARKLGVLTYRRYALDERTSDSNLTHHIALMRSPRFVVKYLPVSEDPAGQAIAGVFVANAKSNDDFARSEPVAHDDWVPDGGRSNPVKVALNRITGEFKNVVLQKPTGAGNENASGVAQVSRMLGSVLAGAQGPGGEIQKKSYGRPGGSGGGAKAPVTVVLNADPRLLIHDGQVYSDFYFRLNIASGVDTALYTLAGAGRVVLDGGAVEAPKDAPVGADTPSVTGWFANGVLVSSDAHVPLRLLPLDDWCVLRVVQPRATAITAVIDVEHSS